MTEFQLLPIFLIGLLGSVHCIGMCGGIVSAFSAAGGPAAGGPAARAARKPFPVPVRGNAIALSTSTALDDALRVVAYNAGRIGSYALAGAIAGGVAEGARTLSFMSTLQIGGYWLANLMLVALGLYLMDAWRGLARLEAVGHIVWKRVQPLLRYLLPVDSSSKALALGALWGWVPCGMVYSVLLTAMLTGSAASGAAVMTVFGLGTLPMLLGMGLLGARLHHWTRMRGVRVAAGLVVLAFGLLGLFRAANGLSLGWIDALCITPGVH